MDFICDKCGSTRVIEFNKTPPKKPDPIKMSEYNGPNAMMHAVYLVTTNVLLCQDCGFRHEYSY